MSSNTRMIFADQIADGMVIVNKCGNSPSSPCPWPAAKHGSGDIHEAAVQDRRLVGDVVRVIVLGENGEHGSVTLGANRAIRIRPSEPVVDSTRDLPSAPLPA